MTVARTEGTGLLSVVGTPIGNLSDVSIRTEQVLRSATIVLCEDTRVTGKLLSHLGIHVPLVRADQNVLVSRIPQVLERIAQGQRVAYVTDAGMPGISDPGQPLVDAVLDAGLRLEVIPGPSALICALVASGLPIEHFYFEGFLPRKSGAQHARLCELAAIPGALVIYEAPKRVILTLETIARVLPCRKVALVRELTKIHEEVLRGSAAELSSLLYGRETKEGVLRGECIIVIAPPGADEHRESCQKVDLDAAIAAGIAAGEPKSALARSLAHEFSIARSEIYERILKLSS